MTGDDDDFLPRLGKMRSGGSRRGRKFLQQVIAASILAGGGRSGGGKARSGGGRTARGAGAGRVLASRDRYAAFRQRRVIVKSRLVKLVGKGIGGARAHLRYIQRDGVTRDGNPGELYDATHDRTDGKAFLERSAGDRHQFRFIVSAEDGDQYDDLKPLVRRLMTRMEADLDTKLEWVAVDHFNTGHAHSHVIVRGKDERGADLVIARDYLSAGMRERAAEIVGLDLGPRTDVDIEDRLRQEVERERLTSLDRRLLRDVGADGLVGATERDPFRQALRAGRLRKLERLGLAEEVRPGRWRLADGLEEILRRMGERGDIIKTLHRAMTERGLARSAGDMAIDDPNSLSARPLVGRVVTRGLSDEAADRHYLIVDGVDGRVHYVDIGKGDAVAPLPEGAVVRIEPHRGNSVSVVVRVFVAAVAGEATRFGRTDVAGPRTHRRKSRTVARCRFRSRGARGAVTSPTMADRRRVGRGGTEPRPLPRQSFGRAAPPRDDAGGGAVVGRVGPRLCRAAHRSADRWHLPPRRRGFR